MIYYWNFFLENAWSGSLGISNILSGKVKYTFISNFSYTFEFLAIILKYGTISLALTPSPAHQMCHNWLIRVK